MIRLWQIGAAANLIILVSYLVILAFMVVPLIREHQLRANPLGTATVLIFFTCAIHHGTHTVIAVLPSVGLGLTSGRSLRSAWEWHSVAWDLLGAAVAIYYITLRKTYGPLMRGPVLFEDLKEQQRRALEINDNVVQGLTVAYMALDVDDLTTSAAALETALGSARTIISELLGEAGTVTRLGPGDLVRGRPAAVPAHGSPS